MANAGKQKTTTIVKNKYFRTLKECFFNVQKIKYYSRYELRILANMSERKYSLHKIKIIFKSYNDIKKKILLYFL